jgi:hypothetical protein
MMGDAEIVPFGKYRNQPVERLLADRSYCEWLAAQSWFRDLFAPLYDAIVGWGEPQDSPVHNAMQARYLDHDEALRIVMLWATGRPQIEHVAFEVDGWDVVIRASGGLPLPTAGGYRLPEGYGDAIVLVELKPTLGDDYPTVLRQVIKRRERRPNRCLVLADRAEFAGVSLAQVRDIFGSQDVTLRLTAELPESPGCGCGHCK